MVHVPPGGKLGQRFVAVAAVPEQGVQRLVMRNHVMADGFVKDGMVEIFRVARRGQRVRQPDTIFRSYGDGQREDKFVQRFDHRFGIAAIGIFGAVDECLNHGLAVLEHFVAAGLGHLVVAHQVKDLIGEAGFESGGLGDELIGMAVIGKGAVGAVDQFVEHQMVVLVVLKIGQADKPVEIALMIVQVAGHDDLARVAQFDEAAPTAGVLKISLTTLL